MTSTPDEVWAGCPDPCPLCDCTVQGHREAVLAEADYFGGEPGTHKHFCPQFPEYDPRDADCEAGEALRRAEAGR